MYRQQNQGFHRTFQHKCHLQVGPQQFWVICIRKTGLHRMDLCPSLLNVGDNFGADDEPVRCKPGTKKPRPKPGLLNVQIAEISTSRRPAVCQCPS